MLHQTRGISLHATKFSETSLIVKIYTELFGLQSYLVKGIRKQNARIKLGLFQPLTLLDLVVYHKEKSSLQNLKEVAYSYNYQQIPFDIRKSSIALFLNELIYKTIHEEEPHPELFSFIYQSLLDFDSAAENFMHFHLFFSFQLTRYLGCMPQLDYSEKNCFLNLREGTFQAIAPEHSDFLDPSLSKIFFQLISTSKPFITALDIPPETRDKLLEMILIYFRLHVPGFREMKSHRILHTLLR
ncbi:MAG: DNA repair protein RecO [Bacteroidales bacterium]|jgi:DNA repair protein RecO (recombination protein O)